ncbi:MAG: STAS domain-containing protein [Phycisphaerae bacterium]|nr:STAS domain-containing protein [Phycisphaerae bacterium]
MPSNIVVSEAEGVTTVSLRMSSILDGPVIEDVGRTLFGLVEEKAVDKLVVDFHAVSFLSSSMLGVLVSLQKKAAANDGNVVLCGLRPSLMKIFTITRLEKIFTFADNESKAVRKLNS